VTVVGEAGLDRERRTDTLAGSELLDDHALAALDPSKRILEQVRRNDEDSALVAVVSRMSGLTSAVSGVGTPTAHRRGADAVRARATG
jgi:hypothetical protein